MDSRRRTLAVLGSAALIFAAAAGVVLWQRAAQGLARYTPVTFLPGFTDKADSAARIEIKGHDGSFAVALTPGGWVLPERGNYPADFAEVRQTLITLQQLTTIAPRTARPDWLHHLALDDPPKGLGTEMTVKDAGGGVLAHLVFGNVEQLGGNAGTAIFVRRPGEMQSYLAKAVFPLHGNVGSWISHSIFDVGPGRLQEIVVTPAGGPGFAVGRARQLDGVSVLRPTLANPNYNLINQLGFAVGAFSIDDVRPASGFDFSGASLVEAHSFDGLAVQLHMIRQGDAYWALVSAQRAPTATEAIAQEAATINARARGWAFKVPAEKGVALMATLAELATPPAPKQGSISLTGMPSAPPPRQ